MQIRLLLSICSIFVTLSSAASTLDSVGVENINGKKIIVHKVEPKESYYSISRHYNINPKLVIDYNKNKSLQIGETIKVPTERLFVAGKADAGADKASKAALVDYKVGNKETLYAISRKFNTTVEEIKTLNHLSGDALSPGQILKIRYGNNTSQYTPPTPVSLPVAKTVQDGKQNDSTEIDSSVNAADRLRLPPARYGLREVNERGVATWIADENLDGSKMLALHRSAPVGTVVKITNPMTGKSIFAKVVGKFTENESTKDVIIVLTKATAEMVGALDKRFQVSIVYGVPNE